MRRSLHFAVTLISVLLLISPYDCLAAMVNPKAADCCAKGKCLPTHDADDCCRNTVPAGSQVAALKPSQASFAHDTGFVAVLSVPEVTRQLLAFARANFSQSPSPPGSPPDFHRNLPLLI
jgi:hypothetical protein